MTRPQHHPPSCAEAGGGPIVGPTRRDVLIAGAGAAALPVVVLPVAALARTTRSDAGAVIQIVLTGGASQLDTFDPKPDAPAEVRGPTRAARTAVPGVLMAEGFARLRRMADRFALVRTVGFEGAATHEAGLQHLFSGRTGRDVSSAGSRVSALLGPRGALRAAALLPGPLVQGELLLPRGEGAGPLGPDHEPLTQRGPAPVRVQGQGPVPGQERVSVGVQSGAVVAGGSPSTHPDPEVRAALDLAGEPASVRSAYRCEPSALGTACLRARRLVERGVRWVAVHCAADLRGTGSWDAHVGRRGARTRQADDNSSQSVPDPAAPALADYGERLVPELDTALAALLDDLRATGLADTTVVLVSGEFGRSPQINRDGGRDHWASCWTALLAGGGITGGAVVGRSDRHAAEPADRPVTPAELLATAAAGAGMDPAAALVMPGGTVEPLLPAEPVRELL